MFDISLKALIGFIGEMFHLKEYHCIKEALVYTLLEVFPIMGYCFCTFSFVGFFFMKPKARDYNLEVN